MGRTPVPQTVSGPRSQTPPPTVAPARRRERSNTTMFRLARRHRDVADDQGPVSPDVMRRRLIAVAIVVAMIVAAVVGVVLASSGKPARHGPTKAQIRAAQQRAAAARRKAAATARGQHAARRHPHDLALTRNRTLTRLLNESTPTTADPRRRHGAEGLRRRACARSRRWSQRRSQPSRWPRPLTTIADDYGRLAAAGRANKPAASTRAFDTVMRDEKTLQGEVAKL